jgi:hypothetical protein
LPLALTLTVMEAAEVAQEIYKKKVKDKAQKRVIVEQSAIQRSAREKELQGGLATPNKAAEVSQTSRPGESGSSRKGMQAPPPAPQPVLKGDHVDVTGKVSARVHAMEKTERTRRAARLGEVTACFDAHEP